MRKNISFLASAAAILAVIACNPIEDQSLRDKYVTNVDHILTTQELDAHLHIIQNAENDDVFTVENDDPSIGTVWHFTTAAGDYILKSDKGTYTYTANGDFEIYAVAPAGANKTVESTHKKVTVTNVYDPWVGMLTGAKDKTDKSAVKTWGFRSVDGMGNDTPGDPAGYICAMSAYGFWKWYPHTQVSGQAWWGQVTYGTAGDQTMKFTYSGTKLDTYDASGAKMNSGNFAVNHTPVDASPIQTGKGVVQMGVFTATCPIIGSEFDDYGQSGTTNFLLIYLDDKNMTLAHYPDMSACSAGLDWNDAVWISYYQAK